MRGTFAQFTFAALMGALLVSPGRAGAWTQIQNGWPFAVSPAGGKAGSNSITTSFDNIFGTDSTPTTYEAVDRTASSIAMTVQIASGGSASVTDCLVTVSGATCDTPATSTSSGFQTITLSLGPTSQWHDDFYGSEWPYVSMSLTSSTTDPTTLYGIKITGN